MTWRGNSRQNEVHFVKSCVATNNMNHIKRSGNIVSPCLPHYGRETLCTVHGEEVYTSMCWGAGGPPPLMLEILTV